MNTIRQKKTCIARIRKSEAMCRWYSLNCLAYQPSQFGVLRDARNVGLRTLNRRQLAWKKTRKSISGMFGTGDGTSAEPGSHLMLLLLKLPVLYL